MANIDISFIRACDGGCHVTFGVSVDSGPTRNITLDVDDIRGSGAPDPAETLATLLRIRFRGLTRQQIRTDTLAGINLVI